MVPAKQQGSTEQGQRQQHDHEIMGSAEREENVQRGSDLERPKRNSGLDSRVQTTLENRDTALSERQHDAEDNVTQHLKGLEVAEDRRNRVQGEHAEEIKNPNSTDARLDRAFERQAALASEQNDLARQDAERHSRCLDAAAKRRETLKSASLERRKGHNDLEHRAEQAQRKHEETLQEHQRALAEDVRAHEREHRRAEDRRASLQHAAHENVDPADRPDGRVERAQEWHLQLLREEGQRKVRVMREHDRELESAKERREKAQSSSLEHIRKFNALDEKISGVQQKHQNILEQRQAALERHVRAHDRALRSAGDHRQSNSERSLEALGTHNHTDIKVSRAQERHERIAAEQREAAERDAEAHNSALEAAENRRARLATQRKVNATDEKIAQTQEARDRALAEQERRKEEDALRHERASLESEERRRALYAASTGSLTDRDRANEVPRSAFGTRSGDAEKGGRPSLPGWKESSVSG